MSLLGLAISNIVYCYFNGYFDGYTQYLVAS